MKHAHLATTVVALAAVLVFSGPPQSASGRDEVTGVAMPGSRASGMAADAPAANPARDIAEVQLTFIDSSRGTRSRGNSPTTKNRVLPTTVLLPPHRTRAPLLVFAIGFNNSAAGYNDFLMDFARIGYVVAAPEFPLATNTRQGRPSQSDVLNEPADIRFVITELLKADTQNGPLHNAIDTQHIAVIGHSDGAIVASAIALNSCCIDRRVNAVVSISGDKSFMPATWVSTGTRPWLGIHGTADRVASAVGSKELFRTAGPPRYLVLVDGAGHLDPTNNAKIRPGVVTIIREFLRRYLFSNARALRRFSSLANTSPFQLAADPPIP